MKSHSTDRWILLGFFGFFFFLHWQEFKQKQVPKHTHWGFIHNCLYGHIHAGSSIAHKV